MTIYPWTPGSYPAGGSDDWLIVGSNSSAHCGMTSSSSKRFDSTKQKAAYHAYASAFFRTYVGGENQFLPILNTENIIPPTSSMLDTTNVFVSYHPGRTDRVDINRTDTIPTETVNTMGGSATTGGLLSYGLCGGGFTIPSCSIGTTTQEPHRGIVFPTPPSTTPAAKKRAWANGNTMERYCRLVPE